MGYFKDVTPESVGISSKGIMKFLDRMEQNQIELHSFMVIRHGQCAAYTCAQFRIVLVHFFVASKVARYSAFKRAVSLGNTLLCRFSFR